METVTSLRKRRKMSQAALAEQLGVDPTTISQYEHGRCMPSLERFADLCEALNVSAKRMLEALKEARRRRTAPRAPVTNLQEVRERRDIRD